MALSAKDQRERDWLAFYCLAEQYRREHGDLLVPNDYVCQGKRLGAWIGTQRMEYKSRTNPRFTQARVDLLNAIGMVWDVRQFQWNRMYQALERYLQKHGTARVPQSYVTEEGVKLGIWLNKVRMEYKRGRLSQARQAQLEALGVVWEPEVLRRESWEHFFALLEDYVVCNGTFPPATYQTEAGVKLGIWLSNQKQDRKNGALAPDRLQKLEALGVIWDVPEQAWMDRYRQAEAYFQCHGHLCPYQRRNAPLPAGLSQWLTAQRKAKQAGKLSPEKSRMLESVGMIWDVYQSLWETAYQQAEAYVQRHGHLRVSKDSGPDQFLGRWISTQRKNYKKGVLNEERTRKLETLGMVWDAGVDSEELWEQWFRKASAYYAAHGHLNPMEGELRTWVLAQRAAKKGKRGCLTEAQIQRLEGIGMVWEPLTDQWQEMYQHAKAYYQVHQMLNVPCNYSTETGVRLGHWIARQRRCYKNFLAGKEGQGIGTITPERIAQLNELGMIWDGTQATAKTSFREKALLFYLKKPFPDVVKVSQWQAVGVELDLYIPSLRIAIEYDGYQWHHNKLALDERKGEICRRFGIRLIRIREPGLPQASRCERVIVLDDSGEAAFAEAICTLFRWLNLPDPAPDIARDRPAILETYRDVTARAWDQSYQAVYRYHRRHGTLSIPADLTSPSGVNLAGWLHSQREAYRSNELTALQIQKLEALGMQWAPFEARWQRMYQLVAAYAQRHGDLRIPHDYVTEEHVRLGSWLAHQRELYRKQALTPQRVNRLEQLGICWAPNQSRRQEYLQAAQAYHQATGGLDIPADCTTETGLRLGAWLANQRKRYRAGTLSSRRIRELEALGVQWEPPSPDRWEEMFSLARAYYQDHGHLRIGVSYVTEDGRALGRWIAQQRRKFRRGAGEGGAHGTGTPKTQAGRDRNGMGPVLGTMVGEIPGGKDLLPGPWPSEPPCELCHGGGSQIGHVAVLPAAGHAGESQFPHDAGAEGAVGSDWNALDPPADESECPAAAIISELLPRKKPAVKLDRRFFLWMHLAFPCKCQRMCLDKSVSK